MKKNLILFLFALSAPVLHAQFYSVKTNLLGLATGNINVEGAVSIHRNWSLHLPVTYNPFIYSNEKRMQHVTLLPGARYWFLESFSRHFLGFQAICSRFHVGGLWDKFRYDGQGYGAGLSYGYAKLLSRRLNFEFEAGLGLVYGDYTKYECKRCGLPIQKERKPHLIPTRLGLSLVYLF